MDEFELLTFEDIKDRTPESKNYDPSRDEGQGVIRLNGKAWKSKLGERGGLVRVRSGKCSRVYAIKYSPNIEADMIGIDYDQRVQLGITSGKRHSLSVVKARGGTFNYLWHHTDLAIRFPFRISIWLFAIGLALGALVSVSVDRVMKLLSSAA